MRTMPIAVLFFIATCARAEAGSAHFADDGLPFEIGHTAQPLSQSTHRRIDLLVKRSVGLDALADRLGITGNSLNFYEYTDGRGTSTDSELTVGFGGKGLLMRLIW
jgi:hypothetical protein